MSKLKDLSDHSYDRALAQKTLKEKQMGRLLIAYQGGMWVVTPELMALLQIYQNESSIVLLDSNDIPRTINPTELLQKAKQRHQEILNDWLVEYQEVVKIRTAKHVIEKL